jgi:hypothetical protein
MKAEVEGQRLELASEDGGESVVLTNALFECTNCHRVLDAEAFGFTLRRMKPRGVQWRNQPQCKECRGRYR